MTPEQRAERYQKAAAILLEDVGWMRDSGFHSDRFSNETLIAAVELVCKMYISLAEEFVRPTA